ncbi:MAG: family 16 glycosylhydrolase [Chthoniobacteraceae bacterium]
MPFSITSYSGVNVLSITADTAPSDMDTDGKTYVSGCLSHAAGANYSTDIQSSTPFSQTYGYFEARCKLPTAAGSSKGMWPAFWMMPADGSSTAEYDIFEVLGNAPTAIWQTAHWNSYENQLAYKYSGPDTSTAFHTYGFQWDANNIRWFVDGILTQTQPNYYNSAMYPMFDLAVGGSWPGEPDADTVFPASMLIKYFYAYSGGTVTDLIMDNTDTTGVTITGSWTASTSTKGYYGSNYLHDGNTGQGTKSIRYTPTLSTSGSYQVFARWTADTNRATNVPISITSTSGTKTVYVNEQSNNGVWVYLGTYAFNSGTTGNLLISNTGANGYVTADAVRFFK